MIKLVLEKYSGLKKNHKSLYKIRLTRISTAYRKRVYITGKFNYIVYNSGQCSKWEMYTNGIQLYNFCLGEFFAFNDFRKNNWELFCNFPSYSLLRWKSDN